MFFFMSTRICFISDYFDSSFIPLKSSQRLLFPRRWCWFALFLQLSTKLMSKIPRHNI